MKLLQNENLLLNSHQDETLQSIQKEKVFKSNPLKERLNKVHETKISLQNETYIMISLQEKICHKMSLKNFHEEI